MIGFKKFDPRAFLESEWLAPRRCERVFVSSDDPDSLATLATLAFSEPRSRDSQKSWDLIQGVNKSSRDRCEAETLAKVAKAPKAPQSPDDHDSEQERAAIIEYDGHAPRAWAEALARLDPALPPGDVLAKRWLRFIDDCGHFLDDGWAQRAAELGWTPFDLFGCDRSKPFARMDRYGLLWLLDGRQLRALTAQTALINTASGSGLTFYKRPHEPGQVLAWEL
jgi:hypothetical protein